jgi:hypothetical protein
MLSMARTPLLLLASNEADQSGPLYNIATVSSSSVLAVNKRLLHVNTAIVTYTFPTPHNQLPLSDTHHYSRINYGDTTLYSPIFFHIKVGGIHNSFLSHLSYSNL